MSLRLRHFLPLACTVALLPGCITNNYAAPVNEGTINQAGASSSPAAPGTPVPTPMPPAAPDADNDGLSDEVEKAAGLNPNSKDSDTDGIPDLKEHSDHLEAQAAAGATAAAAPAVHPGTVSTALEDTDGDGIPNQLEHYGYVVEGNQFKLWGSFEKDASGTLVHKPGSYAVRYFKSDPLNRNTDGDAYDDPTEAKGILPNGTAVSAAFAAPGNHPMIPAIPDMWCEIAGLDITLDKTTTVSKSQTQSQQVTDSTDNEQITNTTHTTQWNVKGQADFNPGGFEHGTISGGYSSKKTTSVSTISRVQHTNTNFSSSQWSKTTTSNPTQAALAKFTVALHNTGTAQLSNLNSSTTFNGYFGADPAAKFTLSVPANQSLTVGQGDSRQLVLNYSLDLNQLRALQLGVPLTLAVDNLNGSVYTESGVPAGASQPWDVHANTIASFTAEAHAVTFDGPTRNLRFVAPPSHMTDLEAAKDSAVPTVTMRDLMAWGFFANTDDANPGLKVGETATPIAANNWRYFTNTRPADNVVVSASDPYAMPLYRDQSWLLRAPAPAGNKPVISDAWFTWSGSKDVNATLNVTASDYDGVQSVQLDDGYGKLTALAILPWDGKDLFSGVAYQLALPNYVRTGREKIVVTNVNGVTNTLALPAVTDVLKSDSNLGFMFMPMVTGTLEDGFNLHSDKSGHSDTAKPISGDFLVRQATAQPLGSPLWQYDSLRFSPQDGARLANLGDGFSKDEYEKLTYEMVYNAGKKPDGKTNHYGGAYKTDHIEYKDSGTKKGVVLGVQTADGRLAKVFLSKFSIKNPEYDAAVQIPLGYVLYDNK